MKQKKTYVVTDGWNKPICVADARTAKKLRGSGYHIEELPSEGIQERMRQGFTFWHVWEGMENEIWAEAAQREDLDDFAEHDGVWDGGSYYYVWAKTEKQAIKAVKKHCKEQGRKRLEMMRAVAKERKGK